MIPSALGYMLVHLATDLLAGASGYNPGVKTCGSTRCEASPERSELRVKRAQSEANPEWNVPGKALKTVTIAAVTRQETLAQPTRPAFQANYPHSGQEDRTSHLAANVIPRLIAHFFSPPRVATIPKRIVR